MSFKNLDLTLDSHKLIKSDDVNNTTTLYSYK